MKKSVQYIFASIVSLLLSFALFADSIIEERISVVLLGIFLYKFVLELNEKVSVKNIIVLIAVLQWLFGAVLGYRFNQIVHFDYAMHVPKETYFGYVLPATLALIIGLYIIPQKIETRQILPKLDFTNTYKKGIVLIIIGFVAGFLPFLGFVAVLFSNLKYIGLFYVYFSKHRSRNFWGLIVLGSLFLNSLGQGMFHDLLLWGTFFITIYFISNQSSLVFRTTLLSIGFLGAMIIQISKSDIRSVAWKQDIPSTQKYLLGLETLYNKIAGKEPFFSEENIANNVTRINQGWIISAVMDHIPDNEPYANGETIKESLIASIFPRFLMPGKEVAGGQKNMELYAGIILNDYTSMDISQVGEGYANFGVIGGIIFMFILGLFFATVIMIVEKKSIKNPELIIWLPFLFLQVVKAETSLVTILNHLIKASVIVWVFYTRFGKQLLNTGVNMLPPFIKK